MYTDEHLRELIDCHKKIVDAPKHVKSERTAYTKQVFTLCSLDDQYDFSGFVTQNITFQESFSIGLVYKPKFEKTSIVLMRCNGIHGGNTDIISHHSYCHIHYATAQRINAGLKAEGLIEKTEDYAALADGILYFVKRINLIPDHRSKYFSPPRPLQTDLFGNLQ
jgi:hypothetical protein